MHVHPKRLKFVYSFSSFLWEGKENFILPIYSQGKSGGMVSSLVHFKEGSTSRAVKKGGIHMGNTIKYFARSGCMAWKGGRPNEGRNGRGFAMSGVEMTVPLRLKVCCLFTPSSRGSNGLRDETALYTALFLVLSPSSPRRKWVSLEQRGGGFGRKVSCGCLRSGWSGNVIIFGRDKAKIAFMDHTFFRSWSRVYIYRSRSLENLVLACRYFAIIWENVIFDSKKLAWFY